MFVPISLIKSFLDQSLIKSCIGEIVYQLILVAPWTVFSLGWVQLSVPVPGLRLPPCCWTCLSMLFICWAFQNTTIISGVASSLASHGGRQTSRRRTRSSPAWPRLGAALSVLSSLLRSPQVEFVPGYATDNNVTRSNAWLLPVVFLTSCMTKLQNSGFS